MLKRPTSRRRSAKEPIILNLVPILDTMVTLISFLLFTMSFVAIVSIESPLPETNPADVEKKLFEKPLQLTVTVREDETEVWSPFDRIVAKKIPNIAPGTPDVRAIHDTLVQVKQQYPTETKVVIAPAGGITYDVLISVMDNLRMMEPTDPTIFVKNPQTGNDEALKTLFPDVIFGNLLGEG